MMKSLVEAAIKQRLVVCVIAVVLFFFGLRAATKLSVDAFPDVTNVQVQIATEAAGRSPEEVERFVTVPVEMAMTGLPGLEEMRSLNKAGLSLITLVFTDATDVYFARQLVMERLIEVGGRMPEGVSPVLGPVSTGLGEVYQYTLDRADDGNRELTQEELAERRIAQDWVVRPLLRSIPGVAEINSQGGYVRQYQALVNPERMRHYQISTQQVYEALARNNANSGGGVLPHYAEQYLIRGVGLARGVDDLGSIVLKEINGTPVYLRDVANVTIGHEVRQGALVKNGQTEAVGGIVMMMRGGNAKEVVSRVKARVAEINERGMLPGKLQIVPYYDRSELVDSALWTVTKVLLEGVVLVVIVLFLFLGDVRSSVIVLATLVLTPLLTFMVMNEVGLSANLMSLGGLAIAIGLMVDGSVVVVENAFERLGHKEPGLTKTEILVKAVQEVATPVIVGVGIIILVFLPLMTLSGMEGKMFAPLAFTISIALAISLFLSLTLSPVLSSYLLKGGAEHDTHVIAFMKRHYLRLLHWALGNSRKTVICAVAAFVATVAIVPLLGTSFIPEMKEGSIVPALDRVPNISLEESIKLEKEANKLVLSVPGVKSVVSGVGRGESPADPQGQNESTPIASLKDRGEWPDGWTQDDIANAIREKLKAIPGVQIVMAQPISDRVDEMVSGVRSDVAVKVFGDDLDKLRELAGEISRVAGGIQGSQDIRIERVSGQQYLSIEIDRQAIARYGLNVSDIHDVIEIAIGGKRATDIFEGERRFAAAVRLPEEFRNNEQAIRQLLVSTPNGTQVPLQSVAKIEVNDGPAQISREMAKRRVVVMINVKDRDLGGFVAELQQATDAKVKLPEGYYLEWGGQFQNMERAMGHLKIIVPVTIAAIFFLLFLLFNSLRFATLIITVLPFASIGGIIGLFVTGEYLSVPASVGFIALWGMAVLNGVVLVSYIRTLRDSGLSLDEAVVQGATQRFRPVMMTATIAMLGLVPFLFSTGPGSEVQRPLAVVVIGGLITSTLLTLVMVPTLYRWFDDRKPDPTRDVPV
ncbi:Cation efflux system protein CzcA [Cupriavidus necator]|uniref:Cobalt-zinc-cadmium resistance efflux pump n=1 Tax=Cupriavidus necator (strain ATCC 17699 / DSM 428 / KCTC 22496 / NCIMB 10442 / H16 / Stanier 337) TaxID=381666 RepID=Q0K035_CUPNH|nr:MULTISPECIES: CusA/CzcA family heavy metal efflux RND transporter [Cupriavidus]EON20745.1 cobalt-zinc-cadmium resistance efflux pump [Cupriavidus sp. GA3-3]QCC04462.1 efflux RND transporter permease subunit [Cupriavidus necator H16]QQB79152.1 efflux RND transporter permease subunit [Cupriavidus necator]WKA43372.1 CusA/CzcA family heavy metal efflux RND transporter [Cupriavidus necator]CAJ96639.1 Cobalt-zinc-cadmium resistance efflux pump [Cupriavidus necator H16]